MLLVYIIKVTECTEHNIVYFQQITKQQSACQVPTPPTDDKLPWLPVNGCVF